ncbi:MAG TPA: hypothetical protein VF116_15630, partial [Ktedonobacterales bacterium]
GCEECRRELAFWSAVGDALAADDAAQPIPVDQARVWGSVRAALVREQGGLAHHSHEGGRRMSTQTQHTPPPSRVAGMPPAPSRRRPIAAAFAFALIVVLSVALFGVVAPRLRHGTSQIGRGLQPTATPTACPPSQLSASLPANAELFSISMVSARDGWAVGQVWDPAHQDRPPQVLMMHFQDCQWRQAGLNTAPAQLTDVAMTSPADGWAVGVTLRPEDISPMWIGEHILLLHYHDGTWQPVALPGNPDALGAKIRMVSPNDGWLLVDGGKSHPTPYAPAYSYSLYHYDGTTWSARPMLFETPSMILSDIAAGPDVLWIVGYETGASSGGIIARYHAGKWMTWGGAIAGDATIALYAVALSSPDSVWAIGTHSSSAGIAAYHFDGHIWSLIPTRTPTPTLGSYSATVLPAGDVYTFDQTVMPGSSPIEHCDLTACQTKSPGVPDVTGIRELALFSATRGFAIADRYYVPEAPQSVLLYFDSGHWSAIPTAG